MSQMLTAGALQHPDRLHPAQIMRRWKNQSLVGTLMVLLLAVAPPAAAQVQDVKFGILRLVSDGEYELDIETTRIPRRLKDTGFRFGVSFSNPTGKTIEWYEMVHLPAQVRQLTGGLQQL